jgi:hypothetical protein
MKKKSLLCKTEKREIWYNLINCLLIFIISLGSSIVATDFQWTWKGFIVAFIIGLLVAATKFKSYWDGEVGEYSNKIFSIVSY